jgi:hypothetical protein
MDWQEFISILVPKTEAQSQTDSHGYSFESLDESNSENIRKQYNNK